MRRFIALILTLVILLPLAACSGEGERRIKSPVDFQLAQYEREEALRVEEVQAAMLRREQSQANRRASAVEREELPDWPITVPEYRPTNQNWSLWHWFVQQYPGVEGSTTLDEALTRLINWRGMEPNTFSMIYQTLDGEERMEYRPDVPYLAASSIKFPAAFMIYELIDEGEIFLNQTITYNADIHYESSIGELASLRDGTVMTFESLLAYMVTQSDNIGINMMYDYLLNSVAPYTSGRQRLAQRFNLQYVMDDNRITAGEFAGIMDEFLEEGPENDYLGLLAEHMNRAPFHQFVTGYLPQNVEVYHKYGDIYDFKNDVGIVMSDRPYYFIFLSQGVRDVFNFLPELGLLMYCWNQRGSEFNNGINERYVQISQDW